MNKQEIIESIASNKKLNLSSKNQAGLVVSAVIDEISKGIKKDGEVQLIGFGTFRVKSRSARKGHNPATGEPIKIKASKNVGFKAGAKLKASVVRTKAK